MGNLEFLREVKRYISGLVWGYFCRVDLWNVFIFMMAGRGNMLMVGWEY